ncbi:adhesive plaque matrix protein [Biomphalaria pfeifferi]|uniref:Adhesive plaque matrix protein n=1 Tax=Biomphalaria pfeifferi TaxID=112525 RepID=A0AAD8BHF9_BIOPF|nr:adhesive plaque matrix protein [Biomphalaria pfeifferi]
MYPPFNPYTAVNAPNNYPTSPTNLPYNYPMNYSTNLVFNPIKQPDPAYNSDQGTNVLSPVSTATLANDTVKSFIRNEQDLSPAQNM